MIFVFLFLTFSLCMTDSSGNLEKWYWWIYFQGSNRDTDTENGHIDAGCGGVELRDWDWFMCTAMKNWCFELWCWRRLLRVPGTARRSNQSILKEISPEYSLDGLMLKLKLESFGHLMWRTDSLEKTLKRLRERLRAGGEGDNRGWDGWMASSAHWTRVWVNSRSWWRTGRPGMLPSMGSQRDGYDWATKLNWTELSEDFWVYPIVVHGREANST